MLLSNSISGRVVADQRPREAASCRSPCNAGASSKEILTIIHPIFATSVGKCGSIRFPVGRSAKTNPAHDSIRENQYPIAGPEELRVLILVFEDRPVADLSLANPRQYCV